jgi:hypothetical protein
MRKSKEKEKQEGTKRFEGQRGGFWAGQRNYTRSGG